MCSSVCGMCVVLATHIINKIQYDNLFHLMDRNNVYARKCHKNANSISVHTMQLHSNIANGNLFDLIGEECVFHLDDHYKRHGWLCTPGETV